MQADLGWSGYARQSYRMQFADGRPLQAFAFFQAFCFSSGIDASRRGCVVLAWMVAGVGYALRLMCSCR